MMALMRWISRALSLTPTLVIMMMIRGSFILMRTDHGVDVMITATTVNMELSNLSLLMMPILVLFGKEGDGQRREERKIGEVIMMTERKKRLPAAAAAAAAEERGKKRKERG